MSVASVIRRARGTRLGFFVMVAQLLVAPGPAAAAIAQGYSVEYSLGSPGRIHVSIVPGQPLQGPVTLVIPRAIPSGYAMQPYDRYVENVVASSGTGTAAGVEREDGPRWRIGEAGVAIAAVAYDVDLVRQENEITSAADTSRVREGYVGILGYSALGYIEGRESVPIVLDVRGPEGWPVYSTLSPKAPADTRATRAEAADFFALADSQILMGPRLDLRRLDLPLPVFLALYAETETDPARHAEVFGQAFRLALAYFGEAPFDHYTACIELLKPVSARHEYGFSMEHLESSTYFLGPDRAYGKDTDPAGIDRDRFNFVHHVTHSWLPKRVYGTGYLPFTWELAPMIETIWFNEGFARHVTIQAIADSLGGDAGREFRRRQLDGYRAAVDAMPGFIRSMPLLDLSRIGSTMYSEDFRTGRTLFMKGALMAEEMDAYIRDRTNGSRSLRDALRSMVAWGVRTGRPFTVDELPALIAGPAGVDEPGIRAIMERWLARREN